MKELCFYQCGRPARGGKQHGSALCQQCYENEWPVTSKHSAKTDAAEMAALLKLPLDCKACGENSSFALQYGCPQARPDCIYQK